MVIVTSLDTRTGRVLCAFGSGRIDISTLYEINSLEYPKNALGCEIEMETGKRESACLSHAAQAELLDAVVVESGRAWLPVGEAKLLLPEKLLEDR